MLISTVLDMGVSGSTRATCSRRCSCPPMGLPTTRAARRAAAARGARRGGGAGRADYRGRWQGRRLSPRTPTCWSADWLGDRAVRAYVRRCGCASNTRFFASCCAPRVDGGPLDGGSPVESDDAGERNSTPSAAAIAARTRRAQLARPGALGYASACVRDRHRRVHPWSYQELRAASDRRRTLGAACGEPAPARAVGCGYYDCATRTTPPSTPSRAGHPDELRDNIEMRYYEAAT